MEMALRAAKLLSQGHAGSRQHSSAGCLHKGMPGSQLIGDHLAVILGSSSRFSCLCETAWVQPLLHLAVQDPSYGLPAPKSRATGSTPCSS